MKNGPCTLQTTHALLLVLNLTVFAYEGLLCGLAKA